MGLEGDLGSDGQGLDVIRQLQGVGPGAGTVCRVSGQQEEERRSGGSKPRHRTFRKGEHELKAGGPSGARGDGEVWGADDTMRREVERRG